MKICCIETKTISMGSVSGQKRACTLKDEPVKAEEDKKTDLAIFPFSNFIGYVLRNKFSFSVKRVASRDFLISTALFGQSSRQQ